MSNGAKALDAMPELEPDVLVLDVMMPVLGGLEVCRRLRARGDRTPILVLTARDQVGDRVAGLDAGADDYLAKPFALEELRARLRALLRRAAPVEKDATRLSYEDLTLDLVSRPAFRGRRGRRPEPHTGSRARADAAGRRRQGAAARGRRRTGCRALVLRASVGELPSRSSSAGSPRDQAEGGPRLISRRRGG